MANSIDSGQPLHNARPGASLGKTSPAEKLEALKQRSPLSSEAQGYIRQAKQDVQGIRQMGPAKSL